MSAPDAISRDGRARRRAVTVTLLLVAVAVAVIVATSNGGSKAVGSPTAATGTVTVQRRNLVTSEEQSGTISYAGSSTVSDGLVGTLTWVPSVGHVINPGQRLFDVDNFPVILLNGSVPAYRALDFSDSPGPDIRQLNANLIALGFDPESIADDDEWQAATTAGVDALQRANGEQETGSLALGDVVFLRGAQRVSSLLSSSAPASDDSTSIHDEFVDYSPGRSAAALARAKKTISALRQETTQLMRRQQLLAQQLASARSKLAARPVYSGPPSGSATPVMTTTSTDLVVTVSMPAGQQSVTHVGARVPVVMPSGSTVEGRVVAIGEAGSGASASSSAGSGSGGGGGGTTVPITIHLDKHENGRDLNQAAVNVRFVERTARNVLSVPVTALLARPGGRYAVQEAAAPHQLLDVTLGTFATGYVQVSGAGLYPGLRVTDSQG